MAQANDSQLQGYLKAAEQVALEAGRIIKAAYEEGNAFSCNSDSIHVKDGVDLVTETDQASERHIIQSLKKVFPNHSFMGEESTFENGPKNGLGSEPTWIIDPLDGTTNFVCGFPMFCVSIALAINMVPVVGVVYNPILNEMYSAYYGGGAFLNKRKIQVSPAKTLGEAVIVNNIGASRDRRFINKTLTRVEMLLNDKVRGYRSTGSAALNMCYVASGKLDAFFEDGYGGPWDVAAGMVIVAEAGGVFQSTDGTSFVLEQGKGKIVCGNPEVVKSIAQVLQKAEITRYGRNLWKIIYLTVPFLTLFGGYCIGKGKYIFN
mmetsp:Transcript_36162/g.46429  ORF Transcript_36162/g.46429 Transcript_36162/m.46429 type:complete len:319 (+) Transcript_36162:152-1108(+)